MHRSRERTRRRTASLKDEIDIQLGGQRSVLHNLFQTLTGAQMDCSDFATMEFRWRTAMCRLRCGQDGKQACLFGFACLLACCQQRPCLLAYYMLAVRCLLFCVALPNRVLLPNPDFLVKVLVNILSSPAMYRMIASGEELAVARRRL